jgi:phosphate transport system substrate-binding protein
MKTSGRKTALRNARLLSAGVVLLGVMVIVGCSRQTEKVIIRGSNTLGEELAPRLIAEYQKEHPEITFDLEFKGTTYGLGALMVDRCHLAAASREVTTNELGLAKDREIALKAYVVGSYSVAVIVNAENPVGNLTPDQVRDIFTGTIQNWKDAGGPDAPIHLNIRDPISGTYLGFQELAMERKPYALNVKAFTNYLGIVQAVERDKNGIGYSSVELATQAGVKPVSIAGIAPTAAAVEKGNYPYSRLLRFYTVETKEFPAAVEFVQFVQSDRGQKILDEMGFVPAVKR